ncbi:hypothetical protein [Nocardioides sp.]|uniref:hypothetical protein n=1 Tax=Nocardioides sp. TaxID=35761 RepID=UPI002607FABC|nr:hypothetical protein [Nocardioides sp.]MDI6911500.1 hypothetical protein [Nocardioides sp.]
MTTGQLRRGLGALGVSMACLGTAAAAATFNAPGDGLLGSAIATALIWLGARLAIWALSPTIEPGPCWERSDIGWPLPGGDERPVFCGLPAGHAGAHVCEDLPHSGRITWSAR